MWCGKCNNHLSECVCPDISERLQAMAEQGKFAYKKCVVCDKHYNLCKCKYPKYSIEYTPKVGEK